MAQGKSNLAAFLNCFVILIFALNLAAQYRFENWTTAQGLPYKIVESVLQTHDGYVWAATGDGLARFDGVRFTVFNTSNTKNLPTNRLSHLVETSDGSLWMATENRGLIRYKDGVFECYTTEDGLPGDQIFELVFAASENFLRVITSKGTARFDGEKFVAEDFPLTEFDTINSPQSDNTGAFVIRQNDKIYRFAGAAKEVFQIPKSIPVNTQPPNVAIENCLLDGKETACDDVKILPENDSLEVKYTGLSFNKPEQIKFKYKLENLDENWVDAGTRRRAYFTHLPPGEYTFRVIAANVDGVWNESGANLKIVVKPPFYRTFWFLSLCAIGLIGIIAITFNRRVKNLKKAHTAQEEFSRRLIESQEAERKRIAAELHDGLGQELLIIKNWALLGLRDSKNKQFDEISETASAAIDEVREISYNLRPFHLDELGLTKAIESMLEKVSKASAVDFIWEIDAIDGFFPKDAEINFYRIVQESVNNIIKHSEASEAIVKIIRGENDLRLSVRDNGKGFDTNSLIRKKAEQSGFGLAGIGERARILGGKLAVNSSPENGTTVNLIINR